MSDRISGELRGQVHLPSTDNAAQVAEVSLIRAHCGDVLYIGSVNGSGINLVLSNTAKEHLRNTLSEMIK